MNDETTLREMSSLALGAGMDIMDFLSRTPEPLNREAGLSVADVGARVESTILRGLQILDSSCPCVTARRARQGIAGAGLGRGFFLVNALDGAAAFLNRQRDFTVNIALISKGRPVMGVVFAPGHRELYIGSKSGAMRMTFDEKMLKQEIRSISVSARPAGAKIVVGRFRQSAESAAQMWTPEHAPIESMSSSLKFCMVASGEADIYPCLNRTMEWDTAAGHAVLIAAGGQACTRDHGPLLYGKANSSDGAFENPWFSASGADVDQHSRQWEVMR